ncbi:penicillin-insensitive murein endopeptidase, partial [Escherichia coli]|uniref:penicillin-insensitive murein endopeptidase n=1 Tax=Escherichia coli TaxID=562 RepID=UPI0035D503FA
PPPPPPPPPSPSTHTPPPSPLRPHSAGCFSTLPLSRSAPPPLQSAPFPFLRTHPRPSFGPPVLVLFLPRLRSRVSNLGLGTVLIGDMGMPAGGRFNGGHA